MTDNEKAATYVGWEKGRACKIFISGAGNKCICGYELPVMSSWGHEELAPDMTLPEQWVRALEAIALAHEEYEVTLAAVGWVDLKTDAEGVSWEAAIFDNEKHSWVISQKPIVNALAELYDYDIQGK